MKDVVLGVSVRGGMWWKSVSSKYGELVSIGGGYRSWRTANLREELVLDRRRFFCLIRLECYYLRY